MSKLIDVIDDTKCDVIVKFAESKYPQAANHIVTAIAKGKPEYARLIDLALILAVNTIWHEY